MANRARRTAAPTHPEQLALAFGRHQAAASARRSVTRRTVGRTALLAAVVALVLLARLAVAGVAVVPTGSMRPTIEVGHHVLVVDDALFSGGPSVGDVVVVDRARGDDIVKRVVAVAGQTVAGAGGEVVVDGVTLEEPWLPDDERTSDFGPLVVPDATVFVLGDNRGASADSRLFGPVPLDELAGRAVAVLWPPGAITTLGG
ncbi:MAG: signal peptidase I [Actinomycetota bacterium]|nr:signal peptidase I [Actinomycetota bacterium]